DLRLRPRAPVVRALHHGQGRDGQARAPARAAGGVRRRGVPGLLVEPPGPRAAGRRTLPLTTPAVPARVRVRVRRDAPTSTSTSTPDLAPVPVRVSPAVVLSWRI